MEVEVGESPGRSRRKVESSKGKGSRECLNKKYMFLDGKNSNLS